MGYLKILGAGALAYSLSPPLLAFASVSCSVDALNALNVPGMTVTSATPVAAANGVQAYCRAVGTVTTKGEGAGVNEDGFDIDLPETWNGKFLFLGGGGFDGNPHAIHEASPQQLAKGYATSSTDSGHVPDNGTFAITAPSVPNKPALIDYFYRARHEVGIASKHFVLSYYGASKIAYSYFMGCSNGGKEGLMEASQYPDDYDGIISGAPWMDALGDELWSLKNVRALLKSFIPPTLFPAIQAEVLGQCDSIDGVSDGVIQNPARCAFNPNSLVPSVLTRGQADAINTIIAPVTDWSGQLIYPGSSVSEISTTIADGEDTAQAPSPHAAQPWGAPPLLQGTNGPSNWFYAYNMIDYLGLYDPANNLNSNNFMNGPVIPTPIRKTLYHNMALNLADDPSLVANFLRMGKKLIMYHGYGDPIISPYRTVLFYEELADLAGGYNELQRAARLFMVPDMGHCTGSTAPDEFGNGTEPAGYPVDAQHDVLTALESWVEQGQAPSSLIATHYVNDNPASGSVDRTMPLCPFPAEAVFNHRGDVDNAANWKCTDNDHLLWTGPNGRQAGVYGPEYQPNFPLDVIR